MANLMIDDGIDYLRELSKELENPDLFVEKERYIYLLNLSKDFSITFKCLDGGWIFTTDICSLPDEADEDFLVYLMHANVLGQATGHSALSLSNDYKTLSLSTTILDQVDYITFKDLIEEIVNYTDFWRKDVSRYALEKFNVK